MTTTTSELPDLAGDYPLDAARIMSYRQNGYLLLRGVCSPAEVAAYRPYLSAIVEDYARQTRPLAERSTYGKAFLQVGNLWQRDENARRFVLARRFAKIAAELMGVTGVRLYHDQALFKEAGGGHTPWHQDQNYWPLNTPDCITMWMPLVDATPDMGTMRFAAGSHRDGSLTPLLISDESEEFYRHLIEEKEFTHEQMPGMQAGDATFHAGWTLHGAPENRSERAREVMTIIYFADGTYLIDPIDSPARQADAEGCFPGVKAGALAVSPLTPLLYSK